MEMDQEYARQIERLTKLIDRLESVLHLLEYRRPGDMLPPSREPDGLLSNSDTAGP